MTTFKSIQALHRANPRAREGFAESVESAAVAVRVRLAAADQPAPPPRVRSLHPRRLVSVSAGGALVAAAAVVALLTVASPAGGPGVEDATGAVRAAAAVTAASAEQSGTAVIRMTQDGESWAGATIRWNGNDLAVVQDDPRRRGKSGFPMLLVGGIHYGFEPNVGWIAFGDPSNIDADSGTTPDEYLAAVREDVGGATLRRILDGMKGLTARELVDGATVYSGTVAAGLIARETGTKGGQPIRVLPFGYVANDEAADPDAQLDVAVTVGEGDVVRGIDVSWGGGAAWTYSVTYRGLGSTDAPVAPENARSIKELRQ